MSKLESLADKFFAKYAEDEEIPETLRSGVTPLAPSPTRYVSPQMEAPLGVKDITPSVLDAGRRNVEEKMRPDKERMMQILNVMFRANMITPIYYQHATKYIHSTTGSISPMYKDFLAIVDDAEKEVITYQKRLALVKELLGK